MDISDFSLVVYEFGVIYVGKKHTDNFITFIKNIIQYQWIGLEDHIVGLVCIWKIKNHVTLSMPGYTESTMYKRQHKMNTRPQHAPHKLEQPDYGSKIKWSPNESKKNIFPP